MKGFSTADKEVDEKKGASRVYIAVVLGLALLMIGVLGLISFLSEPKEASLDSLGDFEGEPVVVEAVVVGVDDGPYSSTVLLYQEGVVAAARVEGAVGRVEVNDRVRVRGEVYRSGGGYALQVTAESSIKVLGEALVEEAEPGALSADQDQYVRLVGVVVSVESDPWGGASARVLGLVDLDEPGNWTASCEVRFAEEPAGLNCTDRLEVCGVVRSSGSDEYLYVYDNEALRFTKDHWRPRCLPLGVLSDKLDNDGDEYLVFPVNVSGYLLYEPSTYPSITLTDHPEERGYTLRVGLDMLSSVPEMSKGDQVNVRGTLEYDLQGFRYVLTAQSIEVVGVHGTWNLTLEELVDDYYLYENAQIRISDGGIEAAGGDDFLVQGNLSIRLDGGWKGSEGGVCGYLRFDEDALFYYIECV